MIDISVDGLTKLQSGQVETYKCFDIHYEDDQEPLRYTDNTSNVVLNGYIYTSKYISVGDIEVADSGKISDIVLNVGNADSYIQFLVERYKLSGKKVVVYEVYPEIDHVASITLRIATVSCTQVQASFKLSMSFDVLKMSLPSRKITRSSCRWSFGDNNCKYVPSAEETCARTWRACIQKQNRKNFGGFPGTTSNVVYI